MKRRHMKGESCSMKRKKYTIGLIILAVIAVIGAAVVFSGHNCDMMISATIHISPEEQHTVYPVREARWSEKEHGAPETLISIDKGRLKRSVGYGPITLKGAFSCEEIKNIWPDAPVDGDWAFEVILFNCHTEGQHYRIFLDIQADTETGLSTADICIYQEGYAHPETAHWKGKMGERIRLNTDF